MKKLISLITNTKKELFIRISKHYMKINDYLKHICLERTLAVLIYLIILTLILWAKRITINSDGILKIVGLSGVYLTMYIYIENTIKESRLIYLSNFINRFIQIEDTLILGVVFRDNITGDVYATEPKLLKNSLFFNRDNVFSYLNTLYAYLNHIDDLRSYIISSQLNPRNKYLDIIAIKYHMIGKDIDLSSKKEMYVSQLKSVLHTENQAKLLENFYAKSFDFEDGNHITHLIKADFKKDIEWRLFNDRKGIILKKIYKKDKKLRKMLGFPLFDCPQLN